MILRMWRGRAYKDRAREYEAFVTKVVFPKIQAIEGHRGTYLLQRAGAGDIEFVVLTLWESVDAIQRFAGENSLRAVVEPEARSILSSFDETVAHYDVLYEA